MIIYKIVNKINGKVYVGLTIKTSKRRWIQHCSKGKKSKEKQPIHIAIQKYGKENFSIEEICCCLDKEELNKQEKYFIKEYNSLAPNGYNVLPGGDNEKYFNYMRKLVKKNASKEIIRTDINTLEEKCYKSATEATKEGFDFRGISACCNKKQKSHRGYQWRFSSDNYEGYDVKTNPKPKPLMGIHCTNKEVVYYESLKSAEESGFWSTGVKRNLLGKTKKYKNYCWFYV